MKKSKEEQRARLEEKAKRKRTIEEIQARNKALLAAKHRPPKQKFSISGSLQAEEQETPSPSATNGGVHAPADRRPFPLVFSPPRPHSQPSSPRLEAPPLSPKRKDMIRRAATRQSTTTSEHATAPPHAPAPAAAVEESFVIEPFVTSLHTPAEDQFRAMLRPLEVNDLSSESPLSIPARKSVSPPLREPATFTQAAHSTFAPPQPERRTSPVLAWQPAQASYLPGQMPEREESVTQVPATQQWQPAPMVAGPSEWNHAGYERNTFISAIIEPSLTLVESQGTRHVPSSAFGTALCGCGCSGEAGACGGPATRSRTAGTAPR